MFCRNVVNFVQLIGPGSTSPVRLCPSCLRRFGDLRKNTPLDFWSMHLVDFVIFNDFGIQQMLRSVGGQPEQGVTLGLRTHCRGGTAAIPIHVYSQTSDKSSPQEFA